MKLTKLFLATFFSLALSSTAFAMPDMKAAPEATAAPAPAPAPPIAGKVLEVLNSGGYTYLLVESEGFKDWVAIPEIVVAVGDEVELHAGTQMGQFSSKPLNRTFKQIIFSAGPTDKYNETRKVNAHKIADMSKPAPGKKKSDNKIIEGLKVDKATGLNAYTIEELFAKRDALQDVKVAVRGQVVKVSTGIMNRNWVHIKDGTGNGENKLVITTKDEPTLGDIVTAVGVFHNNVDFGGGYQYAVIMEDAAIK
jgi:hypothetical protein